MKYLKLYEQFRLILEADEKKLLTEFFKKDLREAAA